MWITELRYIHGSRENPEAIEVEWRFGDGTTAAATVNVNLFLCRVWKHTCKDGTEHRFGVDERLRILKFLRGERQKIRDQSPVKTYAAWTASGLPTFEDFCFPGDEVDEEMVNHFLSCVPPTSNSPGYVQCGEPYDMQKDASGRSRSTYATFVDKYGGERSKWVFLGYCFKGEFENRRPAKTHLDALIEEAEADVKAAERFWEEDK